MPGSDRVVTLPCGDVAGVVQDGVARHLGIPYAAAPVGENRFRLPRPAPAWTGVRDATGFGPTAPQSPYPGALNPLLPSVIVPGDDFLNLNIWAPAEATDAPVMVWIHGGSFAHGSNALDIYDGTAFARDGVVLVAVNYRLGAEGFSDLDGAPLNLGIADQLAALRWVQANIAAFGGDPSRVTVFGQSAGGGSVAALLAHPEAPSLMNRAIIQSGPLQTGSRSPITRSIAKVLGIPCTRDAFAAVSPTELLRAQDTVTAGGTPITGGPSFRLTVGGDIVPRDPFDVLREGVAIPLLIGTTTQEYRLWFVPTGKLGSFTRLHLFLARLKFTVSAAAVRTYRRNRHGAPAGVILGALATDLLLRVPANEVADARLSRGAPTHVYEFDWRSPVGTDAAGPLGAAHAMELGFVFDRLDGPDARALAGPDAPAELATLMHRAWVDFAVSGDPGWAAWTQDRPVQRFDGADNPLLYAPREDERRSLTS